MLSNLDVPAAGGRVLELGGGSGGRAHIGGVRVINYGANSPGAPCFDVAAGGLVVDGSNITGAGGAGSVYAGAGQKFAGQYTAV